MKKLILSLVVVLAMSSFTTLNTEKTNEKLVEKEFIENFGPASECVKASKEKALWAVHVNGGDPMDYYMAYYIDCYYAV